jgi:hypothetical protein
MFLLMAATHTRVSLRWPGFFLSNPDCDAYADSDPDSGSD